MRRLHQRRRGMGVVEAAYHRHVVGDQRRPRLARGTLLVLGVIAHVFPPASTRRGFVIALARTGRI
jgi:hypothetical protein